jgi:hypothetical protein
MREKGRGEEERRGEERRGGKPYFCALNNRKDVLRASQDLARPHTSQAQC